MTERPEVGSADRDVGEDITSFFDKQKQLILVLAGTDAEKKKILNKFISDQTTALDNLKKSLAGAPRPEQQPSLKAENLRFLADLVIEGHKALLLISGGALIAILAFLGNIWGSDGVANVVAKLTFPAILLMASLILALISWLAAYTSQFFHLAKNENLHKASLIGSILLTLAAIGAFVCGSYNAIQAFSAERQKPPTQSEPRDNTSPTNAQPSGG